MSGPEIRRMTNVGSGSRSGDHGARTSTDALGVIREMAGRRSDEAIAACLNRMGMRTGQGKTWNGKGVSSIRRVNGIHGSLSADKDGPYRTMTEAADDLGVTNHVIRRLIKDGTLPANRLVEGARYQIRAEDLRTAAVIRALKSKRRPCRASAFPGPYALALDGSLMVQGMSSSMRDRG